MEALDQKDLELERLATLDKEIDGLLSEGASFNERDDEIVGLQREKAENMSDGAASGKKMTVKEKIEKNLHMWRDWSNGPWLLRTETLAL